MGSIQSGMRTAQWLSMSQSECTREGFKNHAREFKKDEMEYDLRGCSYMVTGANMGIGTAVCEQLLLRNARVHIVCRNEERGSETREHLLQRTQCSEDNVVLHVLNFADPVQVREFGQRFQDGDLVGIVHNASLVHEKRRTHRANGRQLNEMYGLELLSPWILTEELIDLLVSNVTSVGGHARVVFVSSGAMYPIKLNAHDLQYFREPYDGHAHHAELKRAQVAVARWLGWDWEERGLPVRCYSMHPGWVDTQAFMQACPDAYKKHCYNLRTPEQGADTVVWLLASDKVVNECKFNGGFFFDRKRARVTLPGWKKCKPNPDELQAVLNTLRSDGILYAPKNDSENAKNKIPISCSQTISIPSPLPIGFVGESRTL